LFEVVLPDGNITKVDQDHHPELYRALRGAGFSNFGIITSFTLEAIVPANPKGFWTSVHIFDKGKLPTLLDQQATMLSEMVTEDVDAAYLHSYGYDVKHDSALAVTMHFHGSHSDPSTFPAIFEYTSKLEPLMERSVSIKPYSDITKMIYDFNPLPGKRNLFVSFSHAPSPELGQRMTNLFYNKIVPKVKNISGIIPTMVMQPIFAEQRRSKRAGNAFGFDEGPALNLVLLPWTWDLAEDDEFIHATLKQILDTSETWAKELGVYHPFIYPNYAGPWQDIWRGYGEENVNELKKLQRRYDPERIFTKGGLASGGFKLNAKDAELMEDLPVPTNREVKDEL
jgi:FAD/FMN-containing dehydrogenase